MFFNSKITSIRSPQSKTAQSGVQHTVNSCLHYLWTVLLIEIIINNNYWMRFLVNPEFTREINVISRSLG